MVTTRRRNRPIDLTASSDEDDGTPPPTSTPRPRKKRRASSSAGPSTTPSAQFKPNELSASQRMSAASSFLAPRSTLFGGSGTGVEKRETRHLHIGYHEAGFVEDTGKGKAKAAPSTPKKAAQPDSLLVFQPAGSNSGSAAKQLDSLEYSKATLLITTKSAKKAGRKKGKGKKKDDDTSADESSDSDSDAEQSFADKVASQVTFDRIVGADPDKTVVRALVASPTMQLPWIPNHFATPKKPKQREAKVAGKSRSPKKDDSDDDRKKIKKAVKRPATTRLYGNKIPLVLLRGHPLEECANLEKWTCVTTLDGAGAVNGKASGMNAKFALLNCRDPHNRLFLRFALFTADSEARLWQKTENIIWLKDFPFADDAASKPADNATHTAFSSSLYDFLSSPALPLASSAASRPILDLFKLFDFSSSDNVRLVTSIAGSWTGEDEIKHGGGLDSLARGIDSLEPRPGGTWKVEYLTPVGSLPSPTKFLPRFYAACAGVPPIEYLSQASARAQAIKAAFDAQEVKREKLVLVYPSEEALLAAEDGNKEAKYYLKWDEKPVAFESASDGRKGLLRECVLKSGRVNHSTMILIVHSSKPEEKVDGDKKQFEAFLYIGSHTPSPSSWGAFSTPSDASTPPTSTLLTHEVGVVYRLATASTLKKLNERINAAMPYERPLGSYEKDDTPASTKERPPPKVKEKKVAGGKGKGEGRKKEGEEDGSD
ncbi:hypothetical protein JCM10207_002939 [Rhodosporidiobolus poonsookiae]